eukprot:m.249060 g.249060  ORF g.249060 m.249060 type:complete len:164 (-) comp17507_c0_seq1:4337-4828(-)
MPSSQDHLTCPVCLGTLQAAVEINCGHALCASCLLELRQRGQNCPTCRSPIDHAHPSFTLRSLAEQQRRENQEPVLSSEEIARLDSEIRSQFQPSWGLNVSRTKVRQAVQWLCVSDYGRALVGIIVGYAWFGIDHARMAWWEMVLVMLATCLVLLVWQQPHIA